MAHWGRGFFKPSNAAGFPTCTHASFGGTVFETQLTANVADEFISHPAQLGNLPVGQRSELPQRHLDRPVLVGVRAL